TPPPGKSARNIIVEVHRSERFGNLNSWEDYTDSGGHYTISMSADTAGNPWNIRFSDHYNPYPPNIVTPDQISLTISAPSYSNLDFSFVVAAAQVAGSLRDDNGNPAGNLGVQLRRNDGSVQYQGRSTGSGFFQLGLGAGDL